MLHGLDGLQAANGILGCTRATGIYKLAGHDLDIPVDTHHAAIVVPYRADGSGHMSSVVVIIHWIRVVIPGIDAITVIDITIAVIVDPVIVAVSRIAEHVGRQIWVIIINSRIDHGYDHVTASGGVVPGFRCIDIGVRGPARLTDIVKSPHLAKTGIIGCERGS